MKSTPFAIVVDTREQNPLAFPLDVPVVFQALGEGDYAAEGYEAFARIERKSISDLLGTIHGGHDRFNLELARLGDYPRAALLVEGARGPWDAARAARLSSADAGRFVECVETLSWNSRTPVVWCADRDQAARFVLRRLQQVVERFAEWKIERCADVARQVAIRRKANALGPFSSRADLRERSLAIEFVVCPECAREPGPRPKPPGPGVCACGRKARAA